MRVVQLAAGAGRMYCGACMQDNRLAARLAQQGHDSILIPLYLPIRTDETDVSTHRVYYGGFNVSLQQKFALFRRLPKALDRLFDAPALLRWLGRWAAKMRPANLGPLTVSVLAGEHGAQRKELDNLCAGLRALKPDLIHLPNLLFAGVAQTLKEALHVPVLCTLAGEDAFVEALPEPYRGQAFALIRQGMGHIDGFIAPTRYYAARAAECFELPRERVHHVPMGIRVDDLGPPAEPAGSPFTLGYLAAICPEKGLATLCEAFTLLRRGGRDCRLRIAGYLGGAGREYWSAIRARLVRQGVDGAVDYVGEVNRAEKFDFMRSLHVFSVPTSHPEPKGFYLLEALASGVPVVHPRHGSFPELIEATGGGVLYDPTGPEALAEAIALLMDDEARRRQLARAGRDAVLRDFTDDLLATRIWALYQQITGAR